MTILMLVDKIQCLRYTEAEEVNEIYKISRMSCAAGVTDD